MTESLNVNVLVAAKEEYTKQLIYCLQPRIYEILKGVFTQSQNENKRNRISFSKFQIELKSVPNWTDYKLEEKIKKTKESYPYLMDLITAIFVSHVKILACVRLSEDEKSIKIKVPSLNTFLHKIIINMAEQIYYNPRIIEEGKEKIYNLITSSINDTIGNQIPIQFILTEYLSGVFDDKEEQHRVNKYVPEQEEQEEQEEEQEEEYDDEEDIPVVSIERPIEKIESGKDFLDKDEIKSFDELKTKKTGVTITKRENIEDSESEDEQGEDSEDEQGEDSEDDV